MFVDGVTHLNNYSLDTPYPPLNTPTTPTATLDGSRQTVLREFYKVIKHHIQPGTLVILDDLSMLLLNGFEDITAFINRLKSLLASVDGTLVSLVHADEEGADDGEQDGFVKTIIQSSELVLQVQPLGSGLARDVHGQVSDA